MDGRRNGLGVARGPDTVTGGPGDDTITSRGVNTDTIACGSGIDSVLADAIDRVAPDCEFVDRTGGAAPAPSGSDVGLLPQSNPNACGVDRLGTAGNDVIVGGSGGDNIFGLGGWDLGRFAQRQDLRRFGQRSALGAFGQGQDLRRQRPQPPQRRDRQRAPRLSHGQEGQVDCGPGHDRARADFADRLGRCEVVVRSGG